MKKHSLSIILFFLCLVLSDVFSQTRVDWRQIKNTPTSIEGYGITNAISTSVLDNALASFTEEVVRIDSEIATITNELERVENLIPNNASFTFQGLSETTQAIKDEHIAIDAVTRHKIASGSVTTEKLYDGAVTSNKIATYTIQEFNMGVNSVGTNTLIDYSVIEPKLATDSVSTRAIQDANVTFYKLDYDTQQQIQYPLNNIADNSIVGAKLATQTITNPYLGYSSVADYNLQEGSVTGYAIRDYTIENNDIATGTVDSRTIQNFSITNMDLADNSVLTWNIATEAVTSDKLGFSSVRNEHLKTDSVWTHNILNYTILNEDIADNAINGRTIASNSVTVDKIKDGEITPSKLNTLVSWSFDILAVSTLNSGIIKLASLTELPPSLAGALAFMNGDLYIKKSGYWDKLLAESDVAIPNNASFTLSGLGEKDFASLTNKPTTLSGYGITDAAPTYHSTIETTYGLGTTSEYGHVRTINNLNQGSHAGGTALSAYQGYVLNNAVGAKLDKAGGMINGDLTVLGNITGTVSTATTALNALTADYATEAGSSVSSNNSDFATYAETAHTIIASSTQLSDTLPIAFESPLHLGSASSYSGFYSPADSTIVMRTGTDSYKFEYNKVTLGEDVTFIGRSADADPEWPNPLYISGSNTALTGGNIALGGYNNPYLALRLKNKSLLSFTDGDIYPVRIASHTYIQGRLGVSDYVSADALYGISAQAERMTLTPVARSSLPVSMPSSGVMYFDYDDLKFYGRVNNSWQILNSSNSDFTLAGLSEKSYNSLTDKPTIPTNSSFTLAGLSEKSYNSLTDKPTIPTNSSFTLAGLSEKNFSSLDNKPTTLSGYGITDGVNTSDSRLTDARTPLAHAHGSITNDGKIGSTSGLVVTTTTGGVLTTSNRSGIDTRTTFPPSSHALNSHTACTLAQINALITDATLIDTNDTRLSNARPASDVSAWAKASTKPTYTHSEVGAAASSHTHNYAGSSVAGGAATSADKLNTNAGSVTQPVYFSNGVPVATTYSLGKSVPSNAVFTDTTYSNMVGATISATGTAGLVPAPSAGAATRYLRSDGTWQVPPDNNTTYTANNGVSLSGTTFSNSGVRSIATGGANGTISVNTNGTSADVAVKGLGTAAYTASTAYATSGHTHNYAGSSSAGGAATSANKLNTNAGSVTQPVYFANGVPVATTYSLGKSVPSNAVFTDTTYSANNGVSLSGTTFSNSGVRSIATGGTNGTISVNTNGTSADVAVKGLGTAAYTDSTAYAASSHTHNYAGSSSAGGSATSAKKVNNALTITLNGGTTEGTDKFTYDGSATKTVDISGSFRVNPSVLENQYRFTMAMSWVRGDYPSVGDGVATYTNGPVHGKGTNAFLGSTLMPNGKVMLTPYTSPNIGIYDPVANTYTDGPAHGRGSSAFYGSTLMPNGKVMLTPHNSTNIGIYDPVANTYTDGPAHGRGSSAFLGSTLMPNGKVMLTPNYSANIGIYDPIADTYTNGPAHGKSGTALFAGSTLMPNGKVMLTPYTSPNIGIYDPIDDTYTDGPAHGKGDEAFIGSTLMPNGKVMLTPYKSANIGIYDPIADTYTDGPLHGKGTNAFIGSTLMPNGKVMLTPRNSANIGIYDPVANTYTDGPAHGRGVLAFFGSTLMPNGKVMLTPRNSPNIGIYDPKLNVSAVMGLANYLRLPFFNKF